MATHYVSQPTFRNDPGPQECAFLAEKHILRGPFKDMLSLLGGTGAGRGLSWAVSQPKILRLTRPLQELADPAQGRE